MEEEDKLIWIPERDRTCFTHDASCRANAYDIKETIIKSKKALNNGGENPFDHDGTLFEPKQDPLLEAKAAHARTFCVKVEFLLFYAFLNVSCLMFTVEHAKVALRYFFTGKWGLDINAPVFHRNVTSPITAMMVFFEVNHLRDAFCHAIFDLHDSGVFRLRQRSILEALFLEECSDTSLLARAFKFTPRRELSRPDGSLWTGLTITRPIADIMLQCVEASYSDDAQRIDLSHFDAGRSGIYFLGHAACLDALRLRQQRYRKRFVPLLTRILTPLTRIAVPLALLIARRILYS
jgi:hypothetical protein